MLAPLLEVSAGLKTIQNDPSAGGVIGVVVLRMAKHWDETEGEH